MNSQILFALVVSLFGLAASAMPCDVDTTRYSCRSQSGTYKFSARTCGYDSAVVSSELSIEGRQAADAVLANSWTGQSFMGFALNLPGAVSEQERQLVIEVNRKTGKGRIVDQVRDGNPAPWKTVKTEIISCKES